MDSTLKLGEDVELGYRLAAARARCSCPTARRAPGTSAARTLMRRQDEVNRYNRPFVTDRITDLRHWRTKGRSYSVPWLQAVVDTRGRQLRGRSTYTVDGLLPGNVADLEVVLLGDWTGQRRRAPSAAGGRRTSTPGCCTRSTSASRACRSARRSAPRRSPRPGGWRSGRLVPRPRHAAPVDPRGQQPGPRPAVGDDARRHRRPLRAHVDASPGRCCSGAEGEDLDDVADGVTGSWWYDGPEEGFTHVSSRVETPPGPAT